MAALDFNFLKTLAGNNNFTGVSTYLRQFKFDDPRVQATVNQQLRFLDQFGKKYEAILNSVADPDDRKKVAFYMRYMAGNLNRGDAENNNDTTAVDFMKTRDSIGNSGDKEAFYIDYEFGNTDAYNNFLSTSGLKFGLWSDEEKRSGLMNKDGKNILRVYKKDFGNAGFFDNLNKGLESATRNAGEISDLYPGASTTAFFYQNAIAPKSNITSTSYDSDGNKITSTNGIFDSQKKTKVTLDEVKAIYDEAARGKNTEISSELLSKGYMCYAEQEITKRVLNGQMNKELGNFALSRLKLYYSRLILAESLTNYDVYATDTNSDTQNLLEITDSNVKSQLTNEVRAAIKENRLVYNVGSSGGRVGTILTIAPKIDKDGNLQKGASGGRQIFVPGLFEKDAREVMGEDPEASVVYKRAEHIRYGYPYDLLNGDQLSNFQGDGSAIYTSNGVSKYMSADEVTQNMVLNETLQQAKYKLEDEALANNYSDEDRLNMAKQYAQNIFTYFHKKDLDALANTKNPTTQENFKRILEEYLSCILGNQ